MKNKREIQSIQRYTFEIIHYSDGHSVMNRLNEGFSVVEMLGITEMIKQNLMEVLKGALTEVDETNVNAVNSPLIHKDKSNPDIG